MVLKVFRVTLMCVVRNSSLSCLSADTCVTPTIQRGISCIAVHCYDRGSQWSIQVKLSCFWVPFACYVVYALINTPNTITQRNRKLKRPVHIPFKKTYHFVTIDRNKGQDSLGSLLSVCRGLVPRLVIYVSQGALFFTSYECIKHVLAVEIPCLRTQNSHTGGQNHGQVPIAA
jgi:hypothetical protein